MQAYTDAQIIVKLNQYQKHLFTLNDFARLFEVANRNTLYKIIQRLEKRQVITNIRNGSYQLALGLANSDISDFQLANFLYRPSYVSLETALSLYGIITGFSYTITSISLKQTKTIILDKKEFSYSRFSSQLFWGYEKNSGYLIADPEKSLLDYFYLTYKGLRSSDLDEFDFSTINSRKFKKYLAQTQKPRFIKFTKKITLGISL